MKTDDIAKNDTCPFCEKFKFTKEYFDKNNIKQNVTFDCPVCGSDIVYCVLCEMNGDNFGEDYIAVYKDSELM